jgi:mannose-1-phosphate guanylyltransferase
MKPSRFAVILAGGSGERFWPLSRRDRPKQLVTLPGQTRSLLEASVDRATAILPAENVIVVTSAHLETSVASALSNQPSVRVWAEPERRNTLGAILWAAAKLEATHGPDATMAVLTSDHLIADSEAFASDISRAMQVAEDRGAIVTIGIRPTRPETAFGYLEVGDMMSEHVMPVHRFHEKPNSDLAQSYVESDRFYWNSGMFFWTLETLKRELKDAAQMIADAYNDLLAAVRSQEFERIASSFSALPNISIDYALMERSRSTLMVPARFEWDDIGSWDALTRFLPKDLRGNATLGDAVMHHSADCLVYNCNQSVTVAMTGVYDLLIVVTDDSIMICNRQNAQEVRALVQQVRETHPNKI